MHKIFSLLLPLSLIAPAYAAEGSARKSSKQRTVPLATFLANDPSSISQQPTANEKSADYKKSSRFPSQTASFSSPSNPFSNALHGLACLSAANKVTSDPLGATSAKTDATIIIIHEQPSKKPFDTIKASYDQLLSKKGIDLKELQKHYLIFSFKNSPKSLLEELKSTLAKRPYAEDYSSEEKTELRKKVKDAGLFEKIHTQQPRRSMVDDHAVTVDGGSSKSYYGASCLDIQHFNEQERSTRPDMAEYQRISDINRALISLKNFSSPRDIEEKTNARILELTAKIKAQEAVAKTGTTLQKHDAEKSIITLHRELAGLKGRLETAVKERGLKNYLINVIGGRGLTYLAMGSLTTKTIADIDAERKKYEKEVLVKKYTTFLGFLKSLPATGTITNKTVGDLSYEFPKNRKAPSLIEVYEKRISDLARVEVLSESPTARRSNTTDLEMSVALGEVDKK